MQKRISGFSENRFLFALVFFVALSGCSSRGPAPSLKDTTALIQERLKKSEETFDVKCLTSTKNISNVLFNYQTEDAAYHAKEEIISDFATTFWKFAQDMNRSNAGALTVKDLDRTYESIGKARFTKVPAGTTISLPVKYSNFQIPPVFISDLDLFDYRRTSNSWKTLYHVATTQAAPRGIWKSLDANAVERLAWYVDMFAIALTKVSIMRAKGDNSATVNSSHIRQPDRGLFINPGLYGWAPSQNYIESAFAQASDYTDLKIKDLKFINAENTVPSQLKTLSTIAGKEVTGETYEALKEALADLTLRLWERADKSAGKDAYLISGTMSFEAVKEIMPYRIDDLSNVIFFPEAPVPRLFQEFEGDTFRDDGLHWVLIKNILESKVRRFSGDKRELRPLDIYAAEEITELVSSYAVFLLKDAAKLSPSGVITSTSISRTFSAHLRSAKEKSSPASSTVVSVDKTSPRTEKSIYRDATREFRLPGIDRAEFVSDKNMAGAALMAFDAFRGVSVADVNGDTYPDLFLCHEGNESRLLINQGGKTFEDTTKVAGLGNLESVNSSQFIDYNNDGCVDLHVTRPYQSNLLLKNDCRGNFTDVTRASRLWKEDVPVTGAIWFDANNDGLLDVYVLATGDYRKGFLPLMGDVENAHPNLLYFQKKDGTFEDVTVSAGVGDKRLSLAAAAFDADLDGDSDLYVVNDMQRNILFENLGNGSFRDVSRASGTDDFGNGMGATVADINGDGLLDFYLTNIATWNPKNRYIRPDVKTPVKLNRTVDMNLRGRQANRLFINRKKLRFEDQHKTIIPDYDRSSWGWNNFFYDYDNNGLNDLMVINGFRPENFFHHDEQKFLIGSVNSKRMIILPAETSGITLRSSSRGGIFADLNLDGKNDVVVTGLHNPVLYLNQETSENAWLKLKLTGTKSNRDGFGARVVVKVKGLPDQTLQMGNQGGNFVSAINLPLHFGLGKSKSADSITVHWPSGLKTQLKNVAAMQTLTITE